MTTAAHTCDIVAHWAPRGASTHHCPMCSQRKPCSRRFFPCLSSPCRRQRGRERRTPAVCRTHPYLLLLALGWRCPQLLVTKIVSSHCFVSQSTPRAPRSSSHLAPKTSSSPVPSSLLSHAPQRKSSIWYRRAFTDSNTVPIKSLPRNVSFISWRIFERCSNHRSIWSIAQARSLLRVETRSSTCNVTLFQIEKKVHRLLWPKEEVILP